MAVRYDSRRQGDSGVVPGTMAEGKLASDQGHLVSAGCWATTTAAAAFWAAFILRSAFTVGGGTYFVLFDDAMISMRYGRNLADGHGLVWNAGGPPVEGISNPLWTVWMAVLHLFPVGDAHQSLLVMLSSALALLATLWVVRRLVEALTDDRRVVLIAVVFTAASYPLVFWALRGMEVGVLALLLTYAVLCAIRAEPAIAARSRAPRWNRAALACSGIAAIAVRLDAVAPVALIALFAVWRTAQPERRRVAVRVGGSLVGAVALMTAARRAYYGDWLPNTYYLKATGVSLTTRLSAGAGAMVKISIIHLGGLLLLALFGVALGRRQPALLLLAGIVAVQVAYSIWVGGDAWEASSFTNRYVTVALPCLAIAAAFGVVALVEARSPATTLGLFSLSAGFVAVLAARYGARNSPLDPGIDGMATWRPVLLLAASAAAVAGAMLIWRRPHLRQAPVLILIVSIVVLAANLQSVNDWWHNNAYQLGQEIAWTHEGLLFRKMTKPDAVIAVGAAGASPYFSRRASVDLLGKSDKHVARLKARSGGPLRPGHNKSDFLYSLTTYHPDIVQSPTLGFFPDQQAVLHHGGYAVIGLNGVPFAVRRSSRRVDRRVLDATASP